MKINCNLMKKVIFSCLLLIFFVADKGYAFETAGLYWSGGRMGWYQNSTAPQVFQDSNYQASLTWNNQGGAKFQFARAGFTIADPQNNYDGINTFGGAHLGANSPTLAYTLRRWTASNQLVEVDIVRNWDKNWSTTPSAQDNSFDIETVALHEFGHGLGLDHSADSTSVMYYQLGAGEIKRNLTQDDINGIKAIYGAR